MGLIQPSWPMVVARIASACVLPKRRPLPCPISSPINQGFSGRLVLLPTAITNPGVVIPFFFFFFLFLVPMVSNWTVQFLFFNSISRALDFNFFFLSVYFFSTLGNEEVKSSHSDVQKFAFKLIAMTYSVTPISCNGTYADSMCFGCGRQLDAKRVYQLYGHVNVVMGKMRYLSRFRCVVRRNEILNPASRFSRLMWCSTMSADHKLGEFLDYMEKLKNYERVGVPRGAGTDTDDGFDLGRMRRLLQRLDNPHTHFRAVHIAGTKGKGSTAAFLSNILRDQGYSVGSYSSPHLLTIRERISVGRNGEPVSAETLMNLFHQVKGILDQSIELENGALTHFEVFTALAFALFSLEKVDFAIIEAGLGGARDATNVLCSTELAASVITSIGKEHLAALGGSLESIAVAKSGIIKHGRPLVIGGPFELHIEHIIRDRASLMNSPVVSACDSGIHSVLKCFCMEEEKCHQICDILIQVQEDLQLFIDLPAIKLQMLGEHQLRNAVTAICAALCLRHQGWKLSDESIRAGLEVTQLPGRSQILTQKEAAMIGLSDASIFVDGAHTEASAKGLSDVVKKIYPNGMLAYVVAMASDKDHVAFARQLLSGHKPEIVLLTEASIAGGKSRMTSASVLKDAWISAAVDLGINIMDIGLIDQGKTLEAFLSYPGGPSNDKPVMLGACRNASVRDSVEVANKLLKSKSRDESSTIIVTGSLHIASALLASLHRVLV